jgi:Tol biopolymer transport system component
MNPRLAPDGATLALSTFGTTGLDVWMLDIRRGSLSRFYENGTRAFFSPDGKSVFFGSSQGKGFNIYSKPADASGEETQITFTGQGTPYSVSPDGRWILQRAQGEKGDWDVLLVPLYGGEPETLLGTPYNETSAMISPDSHFVAYVSDESGQDEVYVRPFPESGQVTLISVDGGVEPLWRRDGTELFYRGPHQLMSVAVTTEPGFQVGKPVPLFEDPFVREGSRPWTNYDVSPDGNRFLMLRRRDESSGPRELRVVLHWFEELERLAPTGN